MGAANVIPGVSGGTIALITGIFERLIKALKSFDRKALHLFITGKFKALAYHIDLTFLLAVGSGVAISILSLAKLLSWLFENYPIYLWAFFFGLIAASIFFVLRQIKTFNYQNVLAGLLGIAIAITIAFLSPAAENSNTFYLFICGVVAICSMILPGLSGSFVLIIMGNYLLLLNAVSNFELNILWPVLAGCIFGLLAFSHLLSWIFDHYRNITLSLLTGFIAGSLVTLWPWKQAVYLLDNAGHPLIRHAGKITSGYAYHWPALNLELLLAICLAMLGMGIMILLEKSGNSKKTKIPETL